MSLNDTERETVVRLQLQKAHSNFQSRRGSVKLIPVVTENIEKDHLLVDGTDTSLFEDDMTLPLPDRNLSVDELESLIIEDIHKIYEMK